MRRPGIDCGLGGIVKRSAAMLHASTINMPVPRLGRGLGMPPAWGKLRAGMTDDGVTP